MFPFGQFPRQMREREKEMFSAEILTHLPRCYRIANSSICLSDLLFFFLGGGPGGSAFCSKLFPFVTLMFLSLILMYLLWFASRIYFLILRAVNWIPCALPSLEFSFIQFRCCRLSGCWMRDESAHRSHNRVPAEVLLPIPQGSLHILRLNTIPFIAVGYSVIRDVRSGANVHLVR